MQRSTEYQARRWVGHLARAASDNQRRFWQNRQSCQNPHSPHFGNLVATRQIREMGLNMVHYCSKASLAYPSGLTKPSGEQRGAGLRWIQALGLHPAAIDYEGLIGAHAAVIGG